MRVISSPAGVRPSSARWRQKFSTCRWLPMTTSWSPPAKATFPSGMFQWVWPRRTFRTLTWSRLPQSRSWRVFPPWAQSGGQTRGIT